MIYFAGFFDFLKDTSVGVTIRSAVRTLFYSVNEYIYKLIIYLYNVFISLCNGKLLDNAALNSFFSRIGLILGLIMFMMVAFSFVKVLVDPDSFNDKQKGIPSIIKRVIIVIVMFGVSSYVFALLANVQAAVLNNNVISKIVLPNSSSINTDAFGNALSSQLFLSFYTVKDVEVEDVETDEDDDDLVEWCVKDVTKVLRTEISLNGDFGVGYDCLDVYGKVMNYSGAGDGEDFIIEYNYLFCFLVGIVVCYLLLTYCISVGVRVVQLAVLQIISPMAIVSYLSPKQDNMFSKWTKIYISTYIDVFIRIAIINFAVYLSGFILDSWNKGNGVFWESVGSPSGDEKVVIGILMIIALLVFSKKAPELIKQLFPQTSSGLGFDPNFGGLTGAIGGFAGGLAAGSIGGAAVGLLKGGFQGFNNKGGLLKSATGGFSSQKSASLANKQRIAAGGSRFPLARIGAAGRARQFDAEKAKLESQNSAYNQLSSYYKTMKDEAKDDILDGKYSGNPYADEAINAKQRMEMYQSQLGNLDRNADDYNDQVARIQADLNSAQDTYNTNLKKAQEEYINDAIYGRNDVDNAKITQSRAMAEALMQSNSQYDGFKGQKATDFASIKQASESANSAQTENTNKLVENSKRGERARADAQHKGK